MSPVPGCRVDLEIVRRDLDNGLVLLAVRNQVPTFAAAVVLDVDQRDEDRSSIGLANLVGDCLDEGSAQHSDIELAEALDAIGATLGGNAAGAAVRAPADVAAKAIALLAEVVREPVFPARQVRRVQKEIQTEILGDQDDPRSVAAMRFCKMVYGKHPYGNPLRGTVKGVVGFRVEQLRRFHARMFRPQGGYVAAAGPHAPEATLDLLERAFGSMRGARPERRRWPRPQVPEQSTDEHLRMRREQVHVFLGHPGICRTDSDYHALLVMDHILGTGPGFTSRISRRLRDEQGLCYAVDAAITSTARDDPGLFTAYIGTSPQHRQRAIEAFLAEMREIRDTLPDEAELRAVQDYLTGAFVRGLERNSALVRYAIRAVHFGLGLDYLHLYPGIIRAITREAVQRVARAHLHPDRVVVVSAGAGAGAGVPA